MSEKEPDLKKIEGLPKEEKAALSITNFEDNFAIEEAKLLEKGASEKDLRKLAETAEHGRNERFKDQFEKISIAVLWLAAATLCAVSFCWFWHLITPTSWHWMSPDQISKIQNILTGGVLTGLAANHFKRRLS